jgi:hypothetical protein
VDRVRINWIGVAVWTVLVLAGGAALVAAGLWIVSRF